MSTHTVALQATDTTTDSRQDSISEWLCSLPTALASCGCHEEEAQQQLTQSTNSKTPPCMMMVKQAMVVMKKRHSSSLPRALTQKHRHGQQWLSKLYSPWKTSTAAAYPEHHLKDAALNNDGQTGCGGHEEEAQQLEGLIHDVNVHRHHESQDETDEASDTTPGCCCCAAQIYAGACPCQDWPEENDVDDSDYLHTATQ